MTSEYGVAQEDIEKRRLGGGIGGREEGLEDKRVKKYTPDVFEWCRLDQMDKLNPYLSPRSKRSPTPGGQCCCQRATNVPLIPDSEISGHTTIVSEMFPGSVVQ